MGTSILQFSYPKNTADVNTIKPDSGRTALHLAVESQFTPGVKFLLQKPEILVCTFNIVKNAS